MNEATFEANLNSAIKQIFPFDALTITHQKTFTLQLGHNLIKIDGLKRAQRYGRLDALVKVNGKPLAVFELKKPGEEITEDDVSQGISYARLLTPMPPLVVISSGADTKLFKTYDRTEWIPGTVSEKVLNSLVKDSMISAAKDRDEAVMLLLGQQPDLLREVFLQHTKNSLKEIEGELSDFTYPLTSDFSIRRSIVPEIIKAAKIEPIVVLRGPLLSGKTNIAAQVCRKSDSKLVPIYINISEGYGILQQIANKFTQKTFCSTTIDQIRQWLVINALQLRMEERLLLIVDGWNLNCNEKFREEINELIDLNANNGFSILLIVEEHLYERVSRLPGVPTKSKIGRAKAFNTSILSKKEFKIAYSYFLRKLKMLLPEGSEFNTSYRQPRILRILASRKRNNEKQDSTIDVLPSITTTQILYDAWRNYVCSNQLQMDMLCLAESYFFDKPSRSVDPGLSLSCYGIGSISFKTAEKVLGNDRIQRLITQGHLSLKALDGGKVLLQPRIPEALSAAAAFIIADQIKIYFNRNEYAKAYAYLIDASEPCPYGDLVATMAIMEAYRINNDILEPMLERLIEDKPDIENEFKTKNLATCSSSGRMIPVEPGDGKLISNSHPWLILSHIASYPIGIGNSRNFQLYIFAAVGSFENILIRTEMSPNGIKGYHIHVIPGHGEVLCGQMGIVEPITFAILHGFFSMPSEMIKLCNFANEENQYNLKTRIINAANNASTSANDQIASCAQKCLELLKSITLIEE